MDTAQPRALVLSESGAHSLAASLGKQGVAVTVARTLEAALIGLNEHFFDVLLIELTAARGADSIEPFCRQWPDLPVLAFGREADGAQRAALRAGAFEYLTSPVDEPSLRSALHVAIERAAERSSAPPPPPALQYGLLGNSPQIVAVREAIARTAATNASILVRGETGTGKELVARAIHAQSARSNHPLVKIHTPAVPDPLIESELFGHEKGAFTGAVSRKPGRIELADGGTLFLDEIADMSPAMQVKLLRLLEDRVFERLGGSETLKADLRFVTGTHRDIEHMIDQGTFREDLFYRLKVVTIWLPPLRARRGDIPLLARHYLARFRDGYHKPKLELDDDAEWLLSAYRWPGNVRELVNFMERLVVMAQGELVTKDDVRSELDEQIAFNTQSLPLGRAALAARDSRATTEDSSFETVRELDGALERSSAFSSEVRSLKEEVARAERHAIEKALHATDGNRTAAARLLQVSRRTLHSKLKEHGLL